MTAKPILVMAFLIANGSPVLAWGDRGHEIVADIAELRMSPAAKAAVEAILVDDEDTLTAPDIEGRATWADANRDFAHGRRTAEWHYVDLELDAPNLATACYGFPAAGGPASDGPIHDCVVNKLDQFAAELSAPATTPLERRLALKYVLHFVGDLHQPLHAGDHHDRGGNCVRVAIGNGRVTSLHTFWDRSVVDALGPGEAQAVAGRLSRAISPDEAAAWRQGTPRDWAMDTFEVAKGVAYAFDPPAGCDPAQPIVLSAGYERRANAAAVIQLEKAGVRLAALLDKSFATFRVSGAGN